MTIPRWLQVVLLFVVVAFPCIFWGFWAGDSIIHLVYAKNAAAGHFFEFNPGEKSAGVTSPGYMLLLAGLFRLFDESQVPLVITLLNYAAWYALLGLVYVVGRKWWGSHDWALVALFLAGILPGSAYNAVIGMENVFFALGVLAWYYAAQTWGLFDSRPIDTGKCLLLGLLAGGNGWLRPEGTVVLGLLVPLSVVLSRRGDWGTAWRRLLPIVMVGGLLLLCLFAFHKSQTGEWVPISGKSRMMVSALDSWKIGPVFVNAKVLVRVLLYFPISALLLFALVRLACGADPLVRGGQVFPALLTLVFLVLYSSVLGAAHLGRYLLFVMPFWVLLAVQGAYDSWQNWETIAPARLTSRRGAALGLVLAAFFAICVVETYKRLVEISAPGLLWDVMRAPAERHDYNERLFRDLGAPTKRPIGLAYQEIQARYWLDERFVVRSLDGRTDAELLKFIDGNRNFDHIGYLKARQVDFIIEIVNYNHTPGAWSLNELKKLAPGQALERNGVTFTRLACGAVKLQY